MKDELLQWTGGAFVHNHFTVEDLVGKLDTTDHTKSTPYMSLYSEGSFSLDVMTLFLNNLFRPGMLITDTQHPATVLDPNYEFLAEADKRPYYHPNRMDKSIRLMTDCILERKRIIRKFDHLSHVLTGTEVDILNPRGEFTVENNALGELDYVTASFHSSIWNLAGNPEPSIKTSIDTYQAVVNNPNVDAISHPTFYLPETVKDKMTPGDWKELFKVMKQKQVAFEVNMDSTNLVFGANNDLDRKLVATAVEEGTPLVIGFDFHELSDWGCYPSPKVLVDVNEASQVFQQLSNNGSNNRFLARVMGNMYALKQMGITPSHVVNSTESAFTGWLEQRAS